jgi:hypothetical protein
MATLVLVDAHTGTLDRFETGGTLARKTHSATNDGPVSFTAKMVEAFRLMPDERFSLTPPPSPTSPTSGSARPALLRIA